MLSDFNCKIFNLDRISFLNESDRSHEVISEKINYDMELLDSLGFHRLFCQVLHDENLPLNRTFTKIDNFERFIKMSTKRSLRRKFSISVVPVIHLSENAPFIRNISALTVSGTNYIFIELPISVVYPDYLDGAINKILYNCRLRPVFVEFQNFASIYRGSEYIERMINIKGAAFQFSLNSNNFSSYVNLIKLIYDNGNTVLFATGSEHDIFNVKRITENLATLKERLPQKVYLGIMMRAHGFLR